MISQITVNKEGAAANRGAAKNSKFKSISKKVGKLGEVALVTKSIRCQLFHDLYFEKQQVRKINSLPFFDRNVFRNSLLDFIYYINFTLGLLKSKLRRSFKIPLTKTTFTKCQSRKKHGNFVINKLVIANSSSQTRRRKLTVANSTSQTRHRKLVCVVYMRF